jgi:hypothetical protein
MNKKKQKLNFLIKELKAILEIKTKKDQSSKSIIEQVRSIVENNSDLNSVDFLRLETLINELKDLENI